MKYNEKYPEALPGDEPEPGVVKTTLAEKCSICGEKTCWLDLDMKIHLCSDKCSLKAWRRIWGK